MWLILWISSTPFPSDFMEAGCTWFLQQRIWGCCLQVGWSWRDHGADVLYLQASLLCWLVAASHSFTIGRPWDGVCTAATGPASQSPPLLQAALIDGWLALLHCLLPLTYYLQNSLLPLSYISFRNHALKSGRDCWLPSCKSSNFFLFLLLHLPSSHFLLFFDILPSPHSS